MNNKASFLGHFIRNDNRHVISPRANARNCWQVCDPRKRRARPMTQAAALTGRKWHNSPDPVITEELVAHG